MVLVGMERRGKEGDVPLNEEPPACHAGVRPPAMGSGVRPPDDHSGTLPGVAPPMFDKPPRPPSPRPRDPAKRV